jgi:hypothetical protein
MECVQRKIKMSKFEYYGGKPPTESKWKDSEKWKRAKNVALQKQSRRENEFIEDTLLPVKHLSGRNQRYATFVIAQSNSAKWHTLVHKLYL